MPTPLVNLPEDLLYRLLPPVVISLDTQHLIQAVVGGIQDRVADLRSYGNQLSNTFDPTAVNYGQVFVTYTGQAGNQVSVTLDADATTPTDNTLGAWAAAQLQVDPALVTSATLGVDPLRTVNVDTLQLLAATLGATLYSGKPGETAAQTQARRQQILATYFPRLKVKGTPQSFVSLAKLAGYDEAAMVPQWSRVSPRTYDNNLFNQDLASTPDVFPAAVLPDEFYDPTNFTDGPYYEWDSSLVYNYASSGSNYVLNVVNGLNPFLTLVQTGTGTLGNFPAGVYTLANGASQVYATVPVASGTTDSGLVATALAPGASFNGVRLTVLSSGTATNLQILGPLSTLKYRSSYYDFYAWHTLGNTGTVPVTTNADLQAGLVTPDGPAVAPWRPWTGGSTGSVSVSLWPTRVVTTSGTTVPRYQASGTALQLDTATAVTDAQRVFGLLEEVRPATRQPGRLLTGWLTADTVGLTPYLSEQVLSAGTGSFTGHLTTALLGPLAANFGQTSVPVNTEEDGQGGFIFSGSNTAGTVTGTYNLPSSFWSLTSTASGSVTVAFEVLNAALTQPEPTLAEKLAGAVTYTDRATGTLDPSALPLNTFDVYPWANLRELAGGDVVQAQTFEPFDGDPAAGVAATSSLHLADPAGVWYRVDVRNYAGAAFPPQLSFVEDDVVARTPALAQVSTGTVVPVMRLGNSVAAVDVWNTRAPGLVAYLPLTDNPNDPLTASEVFGQVVTGTAVQPADRLWTDYGWALSLSVGSLAVANVAGQAFGLRVNVTNFIDSLVGPGPIVTVGALGLYTNANNSLYAALAGGAQTASITVNYNDWCYVVVGSSDGTTVHLHVIQDGVLTTVTATGTTVDLSYNLTVSATQPQTILQDLCVWSSPRTTAQLWALATPKLSPCEVPAGLPYASTAYGDRYAFQLQPSGYAFLSQSLPSHVVVKGLQSTVTRYAGDGGYVGDPEFKRVGLGGLQMLPQTYQLGAQGIVLPATGGLITGGTWSYLPEFTPAWNTSGTVVYTTTPPYTGTGGLLVSNPYTGSIWPPPLTYFNGVTDRFYLAGDTNQTYECYLDDLGTGPGLYTQLPVRNWQGGTPSPFPGGREQPTDGLLSYQTGTLSFSVNSSGQVYGKVVSSEFANSRQITTESSGSYITTESGLILSTEFTAASLIANQPLYLYMHDRVVSSQANAFNCWLNPNAFGQPLGIAALDDAGELDFELTGPVPAGWARFIFNVGNLGYVDDAFVGFNVELSIEATGQAPVLVAGALLTTGTGLNPQGNSFIEANLPSAINGNFILRVTWTNPRSVPAKGWTRALAIYGITVRQVKTQLYSVSLDQTQQASPLVISQVDLATPNVSDPAPGAWVAYLNNLGQPAAWVHEANLYATTQGEDTYNNPSRPAANSLTASTTRKFDARVTNPVTYPDDTVFVGPVIQSLSVSPVAPYYNVGQAVTFKTTATGTNLRYVWYLPGGTNVTTTGTFATTLQTAGTVELGLLAVDSYGTAAQAQLPLVINTPPQFNYLTATPNNVPGPFTTQLHANVYSPGSNYANPVNFTVNWYSGSNYVATGTTVSGYTVSNSDVLTAVATDTLGGVATANLRLVSNPTQAPLVTLGNCTTAVKANWPTNLSFNAVGIDPNGGPITAAWTFWDKTSAVGQLAPLPLLGNGTICQVTRLNTQVAPGYQPYVITVTNQEGLTASAGGGLSSVANQVPVLASLTVSDPGVVAGTPVYYSANAIDPDGDRLAYTWTFPSLSQTMYGPNVALSTAGMVNGATITGNLNVDDSYGGVINVTAPTVGIYSTGLGKLTLNPAGGNYTASAVVTLALATPNNEATIVYTLDGSDPQTATDGNVYSGEAVVTYVAGTSVTLTARAFLNGVAPSPKVTATYIFS